MDPAERGPPLTPSCLLRRATLSENARRRMRCDARPTGLPGNVWAKMALKVEMPACKRGLDPEIQPTAISLGSDVRRPKSSMATGTCVVGLSNDVAFCWFL